MRFALHLWGLAALRVYLTKPASEMQGWLAVHEIWYVKDVLQDFLQDFLQDIQPHYQQQFLWTPAMAFFASHTDNAPT